MSEIPLSIGQQNSIRSLQDAGTLDARTTARLTTGKKIDGVTDDAVAFFRAQSLSGRASALNIRKADVDQSIQTLKATLDGTSAVEGLLFQLKAIAQASRGAPVHQRISATAQFKSVSKQLAQIINDTSYQGLNLLTSTAATLTTQFSERSDATLTVNGFAVLGHPTLASQAGSLNAGLFAPQPGAIVPGRHGYVASGQSGYLPAIEQDGSVNFFSFNSVPIPISATASGNSLIEGFSNLDVAGSAPTRATPNGSVELIPANLAQDIYGSIDRTIDGAINQIRAVSSRLGIDVGILQTRASFTSDYATALQSGSDKLTLADLNEEAAHAQALQLRQQILLQSLGGGGPSSASILQLLK